MDVINCCVTAGNKFIEQPNKIIELLYLMHFEKNIRFLSLGRESTGVNFAIGIITV